MAGEGGGVDRGRVAGIAAAAGRPVRPEDVWNAAVRAGADPARMALSLCHVLGEVTAAAAAAGAEDDVVPVRYTLADGREVVYAATLDNPFRHPRDG
jgi:hypothetical protein